MMGLKTSLSKEGNQQSAICYHSNEASGRPVGPWINEFAPHVKVATKISGGEDAACSFDIVRLFVQFVI